jgi:hypothetical protein
MPKKLYTFIVTGLVLVIRMMLMSLFSTGSKRLRVVLTCAW